MKDRTHHRQRIVAVAFAVLAAGPLIGCSVLPSTHVVAFGTPYYLDGPDQAGAPDGFLNRGDKVWVMREKDSYSHLFTEDGTLSWVWSPSLVTWRAFEKETQGGKKAKGDGRQPRMRAK